MGRTACTEPQCPYKGALFFYCTHCGKNANEFKYTIICQWCFSNILYCNTSQNIFASSTNGVTYLISKNIKTVIYGNCTPNNLSPVNKSCSTDLGTALAQWLRCCATNRKVVGSIPMDRGWDLVNVWPKSRAHFTYRTQAQSQRDGSPTAGWLKKWNLQSRTENPPISRQNTSVTGILT